MKIFLGTTGDKCQKESLDKIDYPNRILSYHYVGKKKEFFKNYVAGEKMKGQK
jgi:hypothetical protein